MNHRMGAAFIIQVPMAYNSRVSCEVIVCVSFFCRLVQPRS